MKWKKICSGHEEWRRTECTAATEPRRYPESRVIATWTSDGSHDAAESTVGEDIAGQSTPFRYSGASENPKRPLKSERAKPPSLGKERIPRQINGE
jgi:hypothetical protein